MKLRKIVIIAILFLCFIFTACTNENGIILFNSTPITQNNVLNDKKVFKQGERVYYLFIAPQKIQNDFIRVQVFTITDKGHLGEEVIRTKDYRLMKDERYYHTDYFTFWESGKYVMQIFSHDNFTSPLAVNYFYVQ